MASRKMNVTAVVLAAGHGKRLMPITQWLPKPLVPVNGSPVLATNLCNLAACGFTRAVVVVGRPTAAIPDLMESLVPPGLDVSYALQKEQRGTGDALLTGMDAAPDSDHYLLMAGDTVYVEDDLHALWDRFEADGVDGCMLLKELTPHRLTASSLVLLGAEEGDIVTAMIAKPSLGEIRQHKSRLADASLHLYSRTLRDYLSQIPLSRTGELEVTSGLVAWIKAGARVAGIVRTAPIHVTGLEDFIVHNVPFGRRLVAVTEIEAAVTNPDEDDKDLTEYVQMLGPEDLPFVYRRLRQLSTQLMSPIRKGRLLAIISEVFRQHADVAPSAPNAEFDTWLADPDLDNTLTSLESHLSQEQVDKAVYHYLAVACARYANAVIGEAALQDALSGSEVATGPVSFKTRVCVRTPARLAFSSSQGSDLSYVIEEKSAVILNCAIRVNGAHPGAITIERIGDYQIELVAENFGVTDVLRYWGDVLGPVRQDDPLVLLKAALRFSGIINQGDAWALQDWLKQGGGGFRVAMSCSVPPGSGLGCSGILAAGMIRGLREFAGLPTSDTELLSRSYCCERYYGRSGYQDIIGGCLGGIKLIQADGSTGLFSPNIAQLEVESEQLDALKNHLLVFYTGRPHAGRPYLLTIPAKYFTRSSDYMYAYENGKQLTHAMAHALQNGDWQQFGALIQEYWDDREYFEPGVTPDIVRRYRAELAPWSYGSALCGSGYGGYMMVVLRPGQRNAVLSYLAQSGIGPEQVLDFEVSPDGLFVEVE